MKQTLYQILGVAADAGADEIEQAYDARLTQIKTGSNPDPNALIALKMANEVLGDPNQRAAYDASLANRAAPPPPVENTEAVPGFKRTWSKWIMATMLGLAVAFFWPKKEATPPAPKIAQSVPDAQPDAPRALVPEAPATANQATQVAQAAPDNPVEGTWSCYESVSGHASQYNFAADGKVNVTGTSAPAQTYKYELSGATLSLNDSIKTTTLLFEERTRRKMVLNMGLEGRRLVCKR